MKRFASVDGRQDRLIVASWWATRGKYPLFLLGEWAEVLSEPASDETVGRLVRSALAACRDGVSPPDFRNDPEGKRRRAKLNQLAGVRSEIQYARGARHVSIYWDDAEPEMTIESHKADAVGGFSVIKGQEISVSAGIGDAELGATIRQALVASVGI